MDFEFSKEQQDIQRAARAFNIDETFSRSKSGIFDLISNKIEHFRTGL